MWAAAAEILGATPGLIGVNLRAGDHKIIHFEFFAGRVWRDCAVAVGIEVWPAAFGGAIHAVQDVAEIIFRSSGLPSKVISGATTSTERMTILSDKTDIGLTPTDAGPTRMLSDDV